VNVKVIRTGAFAIAASLLAAAIAHSEEAPDRTGPCDSKAIYAGVDDSGRVLRLTISDLRVDTWRRLSSRPSSAEPHWTALIGTGRALEESAKRDRK
jgi:hypothetical protein